MLQGPTMRRCSELLTEERPASQGGPQPQRRTQRPWPRRRQFGIRGHGHDTMNSRTGASTGMAKNRSLPAAQPPSCDRNINTVLAGCYRTMTARQDMSHRLLKAWQRSRAATVMGRVTCQNPHIHMKEPQCSCFNFEA